jgi:arsenate reductase
MAAATDVTIWHNPRCSKSRATLELLHAHDVEPAVVDYQKNPPSTSQIAHALELLGAQPRDLMRKGEAIYGELGLEDPQLTREQLIDAMATHPILIERPVVFANGKAAIGRPPEKVLAIL